MSEAEPDELVLKRECDGLGLKSRAVGRAPGPAEVGLARWPMRQAAPTGKALSEDPSLGTPIRRATHFSRPSVLQRLEANALANPQTLPPHLSTPLSSSLLSLSVSPSPYICPLPESERSTLRGGGGGRNQQHPTAWLRRSGANYILRHHRSICAAGITKAPAAPRLAHALARTGKPT